MRSYTIVVAFTLGVTAALAGCVVRGPIRKQALEQKQALEMMKEHMELQMAMLAEVNRSIVGYGVVSIQPRPSGAELLIDGAEVLGDAHSLAVPLGVHEFTARWADGATATRRVFVPQMNVTYNLDYKATGGRSRGSIKYSGKPDVKKTVIVLEKPRQAR